MTEADSNQIITSIPATGAATSRLDIPAGSSLQTFYEHAACPALLQRTISGWLSWQQRAEITHAQVLLSPGLAPTWIAALLTLDARVVYGSDKKQEAPLSELLHGCGLHGRQLQSLQVPVATGQLRWGEAHVARMPADQPIVAVVVTVEVNGGVVRRARLALTGAWHEQARLAEAGGLLNNHTLDDEQIEAVAQAVGKEVTPAGDFRASVAYRRAMAVVLTRRALQQCQ